MIGHQQSSNNCWNGRDRGSYHYPVVDDGLASQNSNPEVSVDTSRPDVDINEQIFSLKLMTKKLENAYNGQHVEWPSRAEQQQEHHDGGYESSGDCDGPYSDDEDCYDDWYEGSGSGDGDDDEYYYEDRTEADDDDGQNWPPWVTTARPANRGGSDDIRIDAQQPSSRAPQMPAPRADEDDDNDTRWGHRRPTSARPSSAAPPRLAVAAAYFLAPVVTIMIGNTLTLGL